MMPLRSCCCCQFLLRLLNNRSLTLANHFSLSHPVQKVPKRKIFKRASAIMAIPANKLFVWQDREAPATSASDDAERFLQFALEVSSLDDNSKTKRVFLKRSYTDTFSRMRARLAVKLKAFFKLSDDDELQIRPLYHDGSAPDEDLELYPLFFGPDESRCCTSVQIANTQYSVVRDPVWLDKIEIAVLPLVDCPMFPSCDWKNTNESIQFIWFLAEKKLSLTIKLVDDPIAGHRIQTVEDWTHVHTGPFYCPKAQDIGKFVAVVADFGTDQIAEGTICGTPIKRADSDDDEFIFTATHAQCSQKLDGNRYRIMSYNILADLYMNLKKCDQKDLFFPYCPKEYQEPKYRYPILLRELEGYNADLMFLQEVDFRMQKRYLIQFLNLKGYGAIFNCKQNEVNEGHVLAFRNERLRLAGDDANFTIKLSDYLITDSATNADILSYLENRKKLSDILTTRPTILQLIHLKTNGGLSLLCANTHLHFDPAHEEVKILQTLLCLRYIDHVLRNKMTERSVQVLFAGDLNSQPTSRAVSLILGNELHLQMVTDQKIGKDRVGLNIRTPFNSACQCITGFPEYTNFTEADGINVGFVGCLDYIWAHPPSLRVLRILPMAEHRLVTKHGAIPSKTAPSDHLPIICEVEL